MKILSVDTSTTSCSVGLIINMESVAELTTNTGQTHSKLILSMIDTVLNLVKISPKDVDAYAVTKGPGSFTGLRIGLSVVKAMALVTQKPVMGISSLDALAYQCGCEVDRVCALLDARRKEVYIAEYEKNNGLTTRIGEESVGSIDSVLANIHCPTLFAGSGAVLYKQQILSQCGQNAFFPSHTAHAIRASSVGYLGLKQIQETPAASLEDKNTNVTPSYIRPSDAEINLGRKKKPL